MIDCLYGRMRLLHHTKVKADIGLAKTIADVVSKGYVPCIPLSEHQPYDLVVIHDDGRSLKLQVKYVSLKPNGTVEVRFRRSWADKNGSHTTAYKEHEFDYYALYCPEKECVLYVPNRKKCPKAIRFDSPANCQKKNVCWAKDYLRLM